MAKAVDCHFGGVCRCDLRSPVTVHKLPRKGVACSDGCGKAIRPWPSQLPTT